MRRALRIAVLSLCAAAAAALAAEAVLRWGVGLGDPPLAKFDPQTEYELVPGRAYTRWRNRITINADGMRGPERAGAPPAGTVRALLIGDSVVYGTHMLDDAEIIPAQLEPLLEAAPALAGCGVEALGMAVSSWGPPNQLAFLRREGDFGAQAAAVVVSAHDMADAPQPLSDIMPYRLHTPATAIGDAIEAVRERHVRAPGLRLPYDARVRIARGALEEMLAELRRRGIPAILVYHPTTDERAGELRPERAEFAAIAAAGGAGFLDLGDAVDAPGGYLDNIHPDATGAARIAGALAPPLAEALAPACAAARRD